MPGERAPAAVLDEKTIAHCPVALSPGSPAVLRRPFPDALLASADAAAFGPNATSDGYNVVLPQNVTDLDAHLRERGFRPVGVDLSELLKAGGGVTCRALEPRRGA